MDRLHSGEPEPRARLAFKDIKRLDLGSGTEIEHGHDETPAPEAPGRVNSRLRDMGRRAAEVVRIANVLSPPPPERRLDD